MTLAFDTSTLVEVMRARSPAVRLRFSEAVVRAEPLFASVLVLHELQAGAFGAPNPFGERAKIAQVLGPIELAPLEDGDIARTSEIAHQLRRQGRPIGDIDTLIAGQALARRWTLVTSNVRHFGRIEGLGLIDWAVSSEPLSLADIAKRASAPD